MAFKCPHLLLLTILAAICLFFDISSATLVGGSEVAPTPEGGWVELDPNDPRVVEQGVYAVNEHNKEAKTKLQFGTVKEARVKSGIGFSSILKLVIKALDGTASNLYEATIWLSQFKKELAFFKKLR